VARRGRPWRHRFNPRAPRGARRATVVEVRATVAFQSARPARGATKETAEEVRDLKFQSARPARGATHTGNWYLVLNEVSIRAPRAGRDRRETRQSEAPMRFNPRAPRGARPDTGARAGAPARFNPRAPRGARLEVPL